MPDSKAGEKEDPKPPYCRPEWVPEDAGEADGFSSSVMPGVLTRHDGMPGRHTATSSHKPAARRRHLSLDEYVEGVLCGDRSVLARAITLVESNAEAHLDMAQEMLTRLLPHAGKAIRIGITGVPGAGKSSIIETMGLRVCEMGHKLAVLAVDPTSSVSGGSILGDKTRMESLSREPRAYIRPSPSGGVLGGVARKSRETIIVCEAAGFDVVMVETVGVGQSEITVRSMVDMFILVQIAGAGDELQGLKKGVMELCDLIVVNKADGDNLLRARAARADYEQVLHYLQPSTEAWSTRAVTCSAFTGDGIDELWQTIEEFRENTFASGTAQRRRQQQNLDWIHNMIGDHLRRSFYSHPVVKANLAALEQKVTDGLLSPTAAARQLLGIFEGKVTPEGR